MLTMYNYQYDFGYQPVQMEDLDKEGGREFDDVILYCLNYEKLDKNGIKELMKLLENDGKMIEQRKR